MPPQSYGSYWTDGPIQSAPGGYGDRSRYDDTWYGRAGYDTATNMTSPRSGVTSPLTFNSTTRNRSTDAWTGSVIPGVKPADKNDNWYTGLGKDILYQSTNPRGMVTGGSNPGSQIKSHTHWQHARSGARDAAYREQLQNQQNAMEYQYQQRQRQMADNTALQEGARTNALASVDQAYAAPSRERDIQSGYDARLQDSLSGLNAGYQQDTQRAGLAAAMRGRLGSSTDAENQAALRNSLQMSTGAASTDAQSYADTMRSNDYTQHEALRNAILSGDPQSAAAYQQMAAQSNQQSGQLAQQSAFIDQNRGYRQQIGNAYSQQLGGLGNAGANAVNSYYASNPGYGGQGYSGSNYYSGQRY